MQHLSLSRPFSVSDDSVRLTSLRVEYLSPVAFSMHSHFESISAFMRLACQATAAFVSTAPAAQDTSQH